MVKAELLCMERERVDKLLAIVKRNVKIETLGPRQRKVMKALELALQELLELKSFYDRYDLSADTKDYYEQITEW